MARAYELARLAVRNGGGPFGALLVVDGRVAAEFGNCAAVTRDVTKHAETGLISAFGAGLGRAAFSRGTLYTSSEPCTMCCGAIRFAGIKRVVYGTTEEQFVRVIGTPDSEQPLNSREIFRRTAPDVKVLGPLMEEEGLRIHEAFWPARLTERSE